MPSAYILKVVLTENLYSPHGTNEYEQMQKIFG